MKKLWSTKILLITMCIVVPHLFAVEISKDTVLVNNFADSIPGMVVKLDTVALWNTINSPITLDSMDIILHPSQDSLFRIIQFGQIYLSTKPNYASHITIALSTYKNDFSWLYSNFAYYQMNELYLSNKYLFRMVKGGFSVDTGFFPFLSFNGLDTCFIYGISIADCFNCVSQPSYLIDFSAQMILYYSNGSHVTFNAFNKYSQPVNARPQYRLLNKKNKPDNNVFNIKGQMLNRSSSNYSPEVYLHRTKNGQVVHKIPLNKELFIHNE